MIELEGRLGRLEAAAMLHGHTAAIDAEIADVCRRLDEVEYLAGEDWLMERDRAMGRAFTSSSRNV